MSPSFSEFMRSQQPPEQGAETSAPSFSDFMSAQSANSPENLPGIPHPPLPEGLGGPRPNPPPMRSQAIRAGFTSLPREPYDPKTGRAVPTEQPTSLIGQGGAAIHKYAQDYQENLPHAADAAARLTRPDRTWDARAGDVAQIAGAGMQLAAPFIPGQVAKAPAQVLGGLAKGYVAGKVAEKGAEMMGAGPGVQEFANVVGGLGVGVPEMLRSKPAGIPERPFGREEAPGTSQGERPAPSPEPPSTPLPQEAAPQTTGATPTVPEAPATIQTQLGQLATGARRVVMVPNGSGKVPTPSGMKAKVIGGVGRFIYDPSKITGAEITLANQNNELTKILGAAEGDGMGAPDKSQLNPNEPVAAVVARDPDGVEAQATATDQQHLPETIQQTEKVTPPGGDVAVEDPNQVIQDRLSAQQNGPSFSEFMEAERGTEPTDLQPGEGVPQEPTTGPQPGSELGPSGESQQLAGPATEPINPADKPQPPESIPSSQLDLGESQGDGENPNGLPNDLTPPAVSGPAPIPARPPNQVEQAQISPPVGPEGIPPPPNGGEEAPGSGQVPEQVTGAQPSEGVGPPPETKPFDPFADDPQRLAYLDKQIAKRLAGKFKGSASNNRAWLKSNAEERARIIARRPDLDPSTPAPSLPLEAPPSTTPFSDFMTDESGQSVMDPLGVVKFAKQDVGPAITTVGQKIASVMDSIKSVFAPQERGAIAKDVAFNVREHAAELAMETDRARSALQTARDHFTSQPILYAQQFIQRMELGLPQSSPELQAFSDTMRTMLDTRRDAVQNLGTGKLKNFIVNYFPHMWKDPKLAAQFAENFVAKRPLEGSKNFLKKRTMPTLQDGLDAGLEPTTWNPVEMVLQKSYEMDKYLMGQRTILEMKTKGQAKFVRPSALKQATKNGWAMIDDRLSTVYGKSAKGELVIRGYYVAPEPAARVLNNYLSPGLRGNEIFRAYMGTANVLNQFQLGMSAFHLGFTSIEASTSKLALGIYQFSKGDRLQGLQTASRSLDAPVSNALLGHEVMKEWYKPGSTTPEIAQIVDMMKAGGARAKMDTMMEATTAQKMNDAFRSAWHEASNQNPLGGLARGGKGVGLGLRAAVDQMAKPIMDFIVPRQKMGALADMARYELDRINRTNPNASREQIRAVMANAQNSIDNRFGQMVYDNMFWNRTAKDLIQASMRSVGWNAGTLREIGGGGVDLAKFAVGKGEFTHRMAYVIALPIITGLASATFQYLMTGHGPTQSIDYFFPKGGGTDENGNPQRFATPSYMKDVYAYTHTPGKTVGNKLHPMLGLMWDMYRNQDYFGTEIRHEDDPFSRQLTDSAKYAAKASTPFALQGLMRERSLGANWKKQALPFIGFTPAPADVNKTPAQREIARYAEDQRPRGQRTAVQTNKYNTIGQLVRGIRQQQDIKPAIQKAIQDGIISKHDVTEIYRRAAKSPMVNEFSKLNAAQGMNVYRDTNDQERNETHKLMQTKINSLAGKPAAEIPSGLNEWAAKNGFKPIPSRVPSRQRSAPMHIPQFNYRKSSSIVQMPQIPPQTP